jgi:hypothetical protein
LVDKLKTAGIPQAQVEAVVRVIAEAQDGLATKHDLTEAKNEIKADMNVRFERIDGELKLNRWMLDVLLAGVISLVLKTLFSCYRNKFRGHGWKANASLRHIVH